MKPILKTFSAVRFHPARETVYFAKWEVGWVALTRMIVVMSIILYVKKLEKTSCQISLVGKGGNVLG